MSASASLDPVRLWRARAHLRLSALFWAGVLVLAALFALTLLHPFVEVAVWENLHWQWAALLAFAAAAVGLRRAGPDLSPIRLAFTAGLGLYLLGQTAWSIQAAAGWYSLPGPSDLLFLSATIPIFAGLVMTVRSYLRPSERIAFLLDAVVGTLLPITIIHLLLKPVVTLHPFPVAMTVMAYPVLFVATAGAALQMFLVRGARPRPAGATLMLAGLTLMVIGWGPWLVDTLTASAAPGVWYNYVASVGIVLVGTGAATWETTHPAGVVASTGMRRMSQFLPLVSLSVLLLLHLGDDIGGDHSPLLAVVVVSAVMLSAVRQALLLRERGVLLRRQEEMARQERLDRVELHAALDAQSASDARYRQSVEVFEHLAEQIAVASDEQHLVGAGCRALRQLMPGTRGAILTINASRDRLVVAGSWGDLPVVLGTYVDVPSPDACLGIQRAGPYVLADVNGGDVACPVLPAAAGSTMCVPLIARGQVLGTAHLQGVGIGYFDTDRKLQASRAAEQVSLAIANHRLVRSMESLALTDPLTGLSNTRFMDPYLDRLLAASDRREEPVGILMLDIDHFKLFNDTYGHQAGDHALRWFSKVATNELRSGDVLARSGGEEFVVVLESSDLATASDVGERIRAAVARMEIEVAPHRTARITVSVGAASSADHGHDRRLLLRAADGALYQAKRSGRDRVCVAPLVAPLDDGPQPIHPADEPTAAGAPERLDLGAV